MTINITLNFYHYQS